MLSFIQTTDIIASSIVRQIQRSVVCLNTEDSYFTNHLKCSLKVSPHMSICPCFFSKKSQYASVSPASPPCLLLVLCFSLLGRLRVC